MGQRTGIFCMLYISCCGLQNLLCCFATSMTQGKEPNQSEMNVVGWFVYVRRCMSCNTRRSLFRYYVLYFLVHCQNLNRYRTKTNGSNDNKTLKWWPVMNNVSSGIFRPDGIEVMRSTAMRRQPIFLNPLHSYRANALWTRNVS
jgi:hypothetical protein